MCTLSGHGELSKVVGLAMREAGLESSAGEPDCEAAGIVVAAGAVLFGIGRAAELAAPPDDRVFEQAAALEVVKQPAIGLSTALAWSACLGRLEC